MDTLTQVAEESKGFLSKTSVSGALANRGDVDGNVGDTPFEGSDEAKLRSPKTYDKVYSGCVSPGCGDMEVSVDVDVSAIGGMDESTVDVLVDVVVDKTCHCCDTCETCTCCKSAGCV